MRGVKWAAALGFLLAAAPVAWAGWEIEQTTYSLRASGKEIGRSASTMRVSKNRARVADGTTISIFDYDKGRIALLLPAKKLYWSGSVDDYLSAVRGVDPKRRALPGELETLPKPQIIVQETPVTAEIAGKATKKYLIVVNNQPFQELWIGEPVFTQDLDPARYQAVQRKMAQSVRSSYGVTLNYLADDPLYKKISTEGYPFRVHTYLGEAIMGSEITRMKAVDVPDSDFAIPEGYSPVNLVALIDEQQKVTDQAVAAQRKAIEKENPAAKPKAGKAAKAQKKNDKKK
jgi:hypothetical protein